MSKSKKKLMRRMQQQQAAGQNVGAGTLAEKLNTVKNEYGNQPPAIPEPAAAPVAIPAAPSVTSAMDDWEDEDETTDGGTIPAATVTVNTESQTTEMQEIANPNIDVPQTTTAPQENVTMNVVNHPQNPVPVAPAPAPVVAQAAPTVIENSDILPETAMVQMQQDAASVPPAAAVTQAPAVVNAPVAAPRAQSAFHHLAMTVMVTLNLSNFEYMTGLKNSLSRVKLNGQEFNLYSPFRKAGKKADANPAAEGIVRYALSNLLDITDTLNNSRVMNVGDIASIQANMNEAVATMRNQIVNLFPASMNTVITELEDEENQQTLQVQLKDIVNIRSWVNSSVAEEGSVEAVTMHNAVINVTVNAGTLYDAEERAKYINQVEKILQLVNNNREEASTTLLLAVNMDSSTLSDKSMRDLLDTLIEGEDFTLYTRQEMHRLEENDFLPQTKESVDADLLSPTGDLLLLRLLSEDDEEEGEAGAENGGEAQPA